MEVCPLCAEDGGKVVRRNDLLRVVLVDDPELPGFVRVIVNSHAKEVTDLDPRAREELWHTVLAVEEAQREIFGPLKMNLASLGNAVPHVGQELAPPAGSGAASMAFIARIASAPVVPPDVDCLTSV